MHAKSGKALSWLAVAWVAPVVSLQCPPLQAYERSDGAQVMEKMSSASPVRLQTSSRLKRSFERVKAQVDVDLLHFRRDLVVLLGSTTDVEGTAVLRR